MTCTIQTIAIMALAWIHFILMFFLRQKTTQKWAKSKNAAVGLVMFMKTFLSSNEKPEFIVSSAYYFAYDATETVAFWRCLKRGITAITSYVAYLYQLFLKINYYAQVIVCFYKKLPSNNSMKCYYRVKNGKILPLLIGYLYCIASKYKQLVSFWAYCSKVYLMLSTAASFVPFGVVLSYQMIRDFLDMLLWALGRAYTLVEYEINNHQGTRQLQKHCSSPYNRWALEYLKTIPSFIDVLLRLGYEFLAMIGSIGATICLIPGTIVMIYRDFDKTYKYCRKFYDAILGYEFKQIDYR